VYAIASQYRNTAIHVMNRTTQRDVRKLKDGDGRYMWQPGLVAGQPATLLGFGVYESESIDSIAANARVIIFGDWKNGYIIVDRVGMTVERVSDTTTVGQNQVALFGRRRYGGNCVGPWSFACHRCTVSWITCRSLATPSWVTGSNNHGYSSYYERTSNHTFYF